MSPTYQACFLKNISIQIGWHFNAFWFVNVLKNLLRKTLAFCKEERPFTSSLESLTKENLRMAKDIRRAEKLQETKERFWIRTSDWSTILLRLTNQRCQNWSFIKSLEMELNQPAEDIDRTSINGKAAAIFLNRICMKDIGKWLRNMT